MSYCVNCGVELDKTAEKCVLCNAPVLNPLHHVDKKSRPPFAVKKGQVERVKHTDIAILLSVILASTAFSCAILNLLIFNHSGWSLYIIGVCILLWVFCIPLVIYTKIPIYLSIIFDGIAIGFYLFLIAYQFPGSDWYFSLAIPITALITLLVLLFIFLRNTFTHSILTASIYIFVELAILCIGLDLLIRYYLDKLLYLSWSAVVLTCCSIICVALITTISRSRLREAVRRRMHM